MSAISLKSITGITSITTPAGVDDQLTLHNNNTTERVKIDVAGNVHVNNHLAVAGVTTMSGDLTISNTAPSIFLTDTNHNSDFRILNQNGTFKVYDQTNGADRLEIFSGGTVAIDGNLDANAGLDVTGNATFANDIDVDGHTNLDNVSVGGATTCNGGVVFLNSISLNASSNNYLYFDDILHFTRNGHGTEMVIDASGRVGINEGTPEAKLELDGRFRILDNSDGTPSTGKGLEISYYTSDDMADILSYDRGGGSYKKLQLRGSSIELKKNNSAKIIVGTGGNNNTVGFSTTVCLVTNAEAIAVRGYSSFKSSSATYAAIYTNNELNGTGVLTPHILFNNNSANRGGFGYDTDNNTLILNNHTNISFRTGATSLDGTERLRIDSSGNVLVGTTDTSVYDNGDSASEGIVLRGGEVIDIARKGDLQLTLNRQTNDGPHIAFYRSGAAKHFISTFDNDLVFEVGGSSSSYRKHRFNSTGDILLGAHGSRIFDDSSGTNVVVDIYGGTTAGKRGILALGGRTGSDNADIGTIQFLNENNANATSSSHAQSKLVASIDTKSETTTNNSGANSGGHLTFSTKAENAGLTERVRILSNGRVHIRPSNTFYAMNSQSTDLVIGDGGGGRGITFWTAAAADNQTISFQTNETLSRAEGEISYGPTNTSTAADRNAMMFRVNSAERLRITSTGNTRIGVPPTTGSSSLISEKQATIGTKHFYTVYHNFSSTNSPLAVNSKIPHPACGTVEIMAGWANGNGMTYKKFYWASSGNTSGCTQLFSTGASRYGVSTSVGTPTMSISGDYTNFSFTFSDGQGAKMEKLKIHFEYFNQFRIDG